MSKINPVQAAALNAPANKAPVKAAATKPASTKPAATKPAATKAMASKPAAKISTPKKVAPEKTAKPVKEKTPKLKMERDSFTMPKAEYAQFNVLKDRLAKLGQPVKKSELLRAGIMQLTVMTDAALKAAMSKVPAIKTGRPNKK